MLSRTFCVTPLLAVLAALLPAAGAAAQPADLSRLVVVGDSLSAGYQNSCLFADQQVNGYASLIARRAGTSLPLPLIGAPGMPPCLALVDPGPPPVVAPVSGGLGARLDPTVPTFNLSVPGARVGDALNPTPDNAFHGLFGLPFAELHGLVLLGHDGLPKSQVDLAVDLAPTTLIVWLGSNDVLWAVIGGDPIFITPEAVFHAQFAEMMARLSATGAAMVVGNVPDATSAPFLTPAAAVEAITGVPMAVFGLAPGDFVTPLAWEFIAAGLPLPDPAVLDAAEVEEIQAAVAAFNAIIGEQAALHGAVVVDTNAVLRFVRQYGLVVGGRRLTADFLGGFFTLDGLHPTNTGQVIVANEFIRGLNEGFDAGIRPFKVGEIAHILHTDPLVLRGVGRPPRDEPFTALEVLRGLDVIRNGF